MARTAAALLWTEPRTGAPMQPQTQGTEAPVRFLPALSHKPGMAVETVEPAGALGAPTAASKLSYK